MSDRYFQSAFSAHNGDFTHGTLAPLQMWDNRMAPGEPKYATPVNNLFMCGQGTHAGPGVTGIPGWNGGTEAVEALNARHASAVL